MKLRNIAEIHMGYTFRGSLKESTEGNTAIIQMRDASQEALAHPEQFARTELEQFPAHYLLGPGDLIFRARGLINTAALITTPLVRTICISPMMFIRVTQPDLILPAYLQWFINTTTTQAQINTYARGATVRMVSAEAMQGLYIVLPTLAVQQKIIDATVLDQKMGCIETELAKNRRQYTEQALLQYAKTTLMQAAA